MVDRTRAAATREDAEEPAPALGILLVHGIGSHKQGETLNEFAAPVIKWIDRWLVHDEHVEHLVGALVRRTATKDRTGKAEFFRSTLRPPDLPLNTPAHARATISVQPAAGPKNEQSWLFAESWWSPQTLAPRVSPFLLWLITRGPWLMLLHLAQRFGLAHRTIAAPVRQPGVIAALGEYLAQYWKALTFFAVTLVWLTISLLLIALWCVVSLVALVPLGYVRQRVYGLLLALTGVVGDSYVLINDPIQRVAFANSARQGLLWLRNQGCTKLAVVAHSQGAAVARDVLLNRGSPHVDLFVTLGPGIAKLDALAERERNEPQDFLWSGAAAPLALVALVSFLRLHADNATGFALWALPGLFGVGALIAIGKSWGAVSKSLEDLKPDALQVALMRGYQPHMVWRDFYASHDPVSNGSLAATIGANVPRIVSERVMVLASLLGDHTAYWSSRADFVARVVEVLDGCAGTDLFGAGMDRVDKGRTLYRRWVRLLSALRWVGVTALLIPLARFDRIVDAARDLRGLVGRIPVDSVSAALAGLDRTLGWIATGVAGPAVEGQKVTGVLLLFALAAVVLHVWGRIVLYWWQHVASLLLTPVFRPSRDTPLGRFGLWLFIALVTTLGLLPPALSIAWTFFFEAVTWKALLDGAGMLVTLALVAGYAFLLLGLVEWTRDILARVRNERLTQPSLWAAARRVTELWIMPFAWLLIGAGGAYLLGQNRYLPELWLPIAAIIGVGGAARALLR